MLLFLPIRTDSPVRRRPRVNHALIALNVLVYLLVDVFAELAGWSGAASWKRALMLWPLEPRLHQFLSYQFLHGDLWHLLGNMLFLWVFGNSVNSKMGNLPYLLFYLASGVFAGVGFAMTSQMPCLGASGAVAGVTTAFLVLFPRSEVTVFYWLWFYLGTTRIRALLLIGLKVILWDNILAPRLTAGAGVQAVAYSAHIAGYLFGFVLCCLLLLVRALPRDQFDIVGLLRRYYQRRQFQVAMTDANARAQATFGRVARPVTETGEVLEARPIVVDDEIVRLRGRITEAVAARDYPAAVEAYESLAARDPRQCLPRNNMLLVANQLAAMSKYPQAAAAYERFLKAYPTDPEAAQVKLLLGILFARHLERPGEARAYLEQSMARLRDPDQIQQARHWLEQVGLPPGVQPAAD